LQFALQLDQYALDSITWGCLIVRQLLKFLRSGHTVSRVRHDIEISISNGDCQIDAHSGNNGPCGTFGTRQSPKRAEVPMADDKQQPNYVLIGVLIVIVAIGLGVWWANA
jgi:hypothetical protein